MTTHTVPALPVTYSTEPNPDRRAGLVLYTIRDSQAIMVPQQILSDEEPYVALCLWLHAMEKDASPLFQIFEACGQRTTESEIPENDTLAFAISFMSYDDDAKPVLLEEFFHSPVTNLGLEMFEAADLEITCEEYARITSLAYFRTVVEDTQRELEVIAVRYADPASNASVEDCNAVCDLSRRLNQANESVERLSTLSHLCGPVNHHIAD